MEDVSAPSLGKKQVSSFTRICGNPLDVLREKGLLNVAPDYQGKTEDRSQNGECPEVDLAFYTEQPRCGEYTKLFSSNHKFKNGHLVYASTQEVLSEFPKELERFNNWWKAHHRGCQTEGAPIGKKLANAFEDAIKRAIAERQKYDRISGNNDKEQITPRDSRMSIKLCTEDHECPDQKVLKWLEDCVHPDDGTKVNFETTAKPEFGKEDDFTLEDGKVTRWIRDIKDYVQRRDRGEDVAPEQMLTLLKEIEENETHHKTGDATNKGLEIKDFKTKKNFDPDTVNHFSSNDRKSSDIKEAKMRLDSKKALQKDRTRTTYFNPRTTLPLERSSLECFAKCHKRNGSYDEIIITKGSCIKNEHLKNDRSSSLSTIENCINREALEYYREKYGKKSSEEEIRFHAREDFMKEIENCQKYLPIKSRSCVSDMSNKSSGKKT